VSTGEPSPFRLRVSLDKIDGRWLVDDYAPVDGIVRLVMDANWYDVLDVDAAATADEIRTAWRGAVADLDPTDRRYPGLQTRPPRSCSTPTGARPTTPRWRPSGRRGTNLREPEGSAEPAEPDVPAARGDAETPATQQPRDRRSLRWLPGWALMSLAGLVAASLVIVGVLMSRPSDAAVQDDTQAAQSAAERAIVPILSYDARHLDQSAAAAQPYLTTNEKEQYDKLFAVIRQNAPRTGTVVQAKYLASGIVRSGTDRVDVLVFVNQVTRNKQHPQVPVVYKNQVTVTMAKVGGQWLVDDLTTNGDGT
jgi:Mce-associated membrane protein